MSRTDAPAAALALDLGSTLFKTARLHPSGRLETGPSVEAPPLAGDAGLRRGDARDYLNAAESVLERGRRGLEAATPLGLTCQRSSFVLWDADSGEPRTPLISWQDRSAAAWCKHHRAFAPRVVDRAGLVLSPHYVGPKLAALRSEDPVAFDGLCRGELLFGTLDVYLLWRRSGGRRYRIDTTMAARTAMLDIATGDWSPELLQRYGVPPSVLPSVVPTLDPDPENIDGLRVVATIADQAAALLTVLDENGDVALVNLGTGGFVLRPGSDPRERRPGFLTAPVLTRVGAPARFALEGSINGAGAAVDRFGHGPTPLPADDPSPDALSLPDCAGIGAPHWRPELGPIGSDAMQSLDPPGQRRVALEGLLFRVREILEGLCDRRPRRIVLAGGLTREPFVSGGLAALLQQPVEQLRARESGLLGAARLAAGLDPLHLETTKVDPTERGRYLPPKYKQWRHWLRTILDN